MLGQIERQVLADRQGLLASNIREDLPTVSAAESRFYAKLSADPAVRGAEVFDPMTLTYREVA